MVVPNKTAENLIPRKALIHIKKYFKDEHIVLIVGSRQTGKTSLLYLIMRELLRHGTKEDQLFYINLEDFDVPELCNRSVHEVRNLLEGAGCGSQAPKLYPNR